jgi:hypothetical protein
MLDATSLAEEGNMWSTEAGALSGCGPSSCGQGENCTGGTGNGKEEGKGEDGKTTVTTDAEDRDPVTGPKRL